MGEAKWFTGARKFPQLIGRTPDGTKLWGGPYTITQVVIVVVGIIVLWNTTWLWARFSFTWNLVAGPGVLVGLVWAAGKLPFGMRNPLVVGSGWLGAVERLFSDSRPVRLPRPHRVGGAVLMIASTEAEAAPASSAAQMPADEAPIAALTGVQQLLLAARK
jgi:hypothetical protein